MLTLLTHLTVQGCSLLKPLSSAEPFGIDVNIGFGYFSASYRMRTDCSIRKTTMFKILLIVAGITMIGTAVQAQPSAEERFRDLKKDIEAALRELVEAQNRAKSFDELKALFWKDIERRKGFAERALEMAQSGSDEAVAVDALTWVAGQRLPQSDRARQLLIQDYKQSDRLAQACRDASEGVLLESLSGERLLRAAMESPHRQVRGAAYYGLAELLEGRAKTVGFFHNDPERARKQLGGPLDERLKQFFARTSDELKKEAETLYGQVVESYADLAAPRHGALGEAAENKLFAMRNLGVGDEAPEIEGEDVDGKRFKLSDYRGKVVVLTFSGNWCGPCRGFYPQERALVERMKGRPFAIVSVNTDEDKETLQKSIDSGEITWRCWRDGGTDGPITTRWSIQMFPSIFVIDHKGVIRHKQILEKPLEDALDMLLKEAEAAKS